MVWSGTICCYLQMAQWGNNAGTYINNSDRALQGPPFCSVVSQWGSLCVSHTSFNNTSAIVVASVKEFHQHWMQSRGVQEGEALMWYSELWQCTGPPACGLCWETCATYCFATVVCYSDLQKINLLGDVFIVSSSTVCFFFVPIWIKSLDIIK